MNSNEVNEVINNLCDKLGLGIQNLSQLVPELAKMNIAESLSEIILTLILTIAIILALKISYKYIGKIDEVIWWIAMLIGIIILFGCFVVIICDLNNLVGWIASPTAKTVTYILNMVNTN